MESRPTHARPAIAWLAVTVSATISFAAAAAAQESPALLFFPALAHEWSAGGTPTNIVAIDVNEDHRPDLVLTLAGPHGRSSVAVMLANGDGTFREPVIVESHQGSPALAAVADATHDGLADLVVASPDGRGVDVLAGTGDGAFHQAARYAFTTPGAWTLVAIAVADMNGDGLSDIVASSDRHGEAAGIIAVALSSPGGSLEASGVSRLAGPAPRRLRVADVDGDGALDVVAARDGGSVQAGAMAGVAVLLGSGNGRLQPPAVYSSDGAAITDIAIADVTGDRKSDVILFDGDSTIQVLANMGHGAFERLRDISLGSPAPPEAGETATPRGALTVSDVDGDGRADILVAGCPDNVCPAQVMTLTGNGDASFQSPVAHGTGGPGTGLLVTADLDGDENLDVLVTSCRTPDCSVWSIDVLLHANSARARSDIAVPAREPADATDAMASPVDAATHDMAAPVVAMPAVSTPGASTYNVRLVTDSSPDLTDLQGLIASTTSRWTSNREKVWALFYWTHILKRQVAPIVLHGFEITDPIRNLLDYGFTQCSTISGINQTLYEAIGLRHQYWDLCNHTVSAVEYDASFHMVDSSLSHLVTTDDGVTLASVSEAAANGARLVKEHSLYSTSPNGFLTGSDTMRSLVDFTNPNDGTVGAGLARAFCADSLKYRDYYYNWNAGHRFVLNLREDETYTRYYRRLGDTADYWVGSEKVSSPDPAVTFENDTSHRFGLRGNGRWTYSPSLSSEGWALAAYRSNNIVAGPRGLRPAVASQQAEVVYKVQAADAITSQRIDLRFSRTDLLATASLSVSVNHGQSWTEIGTAGATLGDVPLAVNLRAQVSGVYETLVRIQMRTEPGDIDGIVLSGVTVETLTQINVKALPALKVGRNEIVLGVGDQSDTMVLWPDLRGDLWKKDVYTSANIASQTVDVPRKYTAVVYPSVLSQDAYLTYRLQAPTDIVRVTYGGRLHNYSSGSYIEFLHSFDDGATWIASYRLSSVAKPYDVIHDETVSGIPAGVRTVLFKFLIHNTNSTASRASGLYAVRMEVDHRPVSATPRPLDVAFQWKEVRADRSLVSRGHRQRVDAFPFKYVINVGGADHPIMESLRVNTEEAGDPTPFGYSDGIDSGGTKYVHRLRTDGTNYSKGRPYTFSRAPSGFQSSAGAGNVTILTDGVVGAPATGSFSYWWGQCWTSGVDVNLQLDLGQARSIGAFRAHLFGYPSWDALKAQVQDRVEVLTSTDNVTFTSRGTLETALWRKDVPINYMLQDDETATGWNFERTIAAPVSARYIRYRVTPKRALCISEVQVFDRITYQPFDIRIALPAVPTSAVVPAVIGSTQSAAAAAITGAGLIVGVVTVSSSTTVAAGVVMSQAPSAGTSVVAGSAVDLVVSSGPPPSASLDEIVMHVAREAEIAGGWTVVTDATAAGGARLETPNAGAPKLTTPLAAPTQAFEVTFTAEAGKAYRLWLRGKAINDSYSNDSVYVQFDGSVTATGTAQWRIGTTSATTVTIEDCSGCGLQGWGWNDNAYGSGVLGPLVYFAQSGPQRLRIQVREDGLGLDQVVLSAVKYLTTRPGATKNDTTILPPTQSSTPPPSADEVVLQVAREAQIAGGWTVVTDATAAGGARLETPNAGAPKLTTPLAAPTQAFEVTFTAEAGKAYRLWLRGKAINDSYSNDSVYVQFDGSVTATGTAQWRIGTTSATTVTIEDCSGCGLQGWGWNDNAYGSGVLGPLVYFAQSGPQRLRIQVREDGLGLDQVVLSAVKYLTTRPGATKNDTTILPLP